MFFKDVYRHNKWMFGAMIAFVLAQACINFNHGAVFTPFFLYGMYSEKISVQNSYEVAFVEVNGKYLRGEDFSIQAWDKIYQPVLQYLRSDSVNEHTIIIRDRLLKKLNLEIAATKKGFVNAGFTPSSFMTWYAGYLSKLLNTPVQSLRVYNQPCIVTAGRLVPNTSSAITILFPPWSSASATKNK